MWGSGTSVATDQINFSRVGGSLELEGGSAVTDYIELQRLEYPLPPPPVPDAVDPNGLLLDVDENVTSAQKSKSLLAQLSEKRKAPVLAAAFDDTQALKVERPAYVEW